MVLMQLLDLACGAKRKGKRDDPPEDTVMDMAWAALKLMFAFSPFIGLVFFMFCSAFESTEKERLKRAKKHGASQRHMQQVSSSTDPSFKVGHNGLH
jgi:hypothetical protein